MKIEESSYLKSIEPYALAEVDKAKEQAEEDYPDEVIDFGVGDPTEPAPAQAVTEAIKEAVEKPDRGYPSYEGEVEFRQAVSAWYKERFGVKLDPEDEITATLGSKQAVFSLPMAYADRDDPILIPDPGYPPYTTGAKQRGAKIVFMPLKEENEFLPSFDEISTEEAKEAKIMWINYPNNPTTKIAPKWFLKGAIDFCEDNNILLVSDEAYSEMYYEEDKKPISLFNVDGGTDVGMVFHSLSKRSNMTNYRIGFVTAKKHILDPFKEVQTNLHSGQSQILQQAAVGALSDKSHVDKMRGLYRDKKKELVPALKKAGLERIYSEGTFYLWVKTPGKSSTLETVKTLLNDKGINATPGASLNQGTDAGEGYLRFALVPSINEIKIAAERLRNGQIFE